MITSWLHELLLQNKSRKYQCAEKQIAAPDPKGSVHSLTIDAALFMKLPTGVRFVTHRVDLDLTSVMQLKSPYTGQTGSRHQVYRTHPTNRTQS